MAKEDVKKLKEEIEELSNKWKRALADYQNLEKRVSQEREVFVKYACSSMVLKILPGLDSLEMAQKHLQDEGLSLALKQVKDGLSQVGLEEIVVKKGDSFNPELMECVDVVEGENDKVVDELRNGYKLHGRILRAAQVRVGKNASN